MDFNLELGQTSPAFAVDPQQLSLRNRLIKEEIKAVKERISGLRAMAGQDDFLAIPTTFINSPAPVVVVSTDLKLREASQAFSELAGRSAASLIFGSDALELFSDESRQLAKQAMQSLIDCGQADPFECELLDEKGGHHPVLASLCKMGPTENDCFIFFFDMASRKAMQKELAVKQSNLAALAEAIPQLIWVSGSDGLITYANERFREFTGLNCETTTVNWRDLLPPEDRKNISATSFSLGEVYADFQAEVRLRRVDGADLWHLLRVVPFFSAGGVTMNWLVIATEIDDHKKLTDSLLVAEEQLRVIADAMPQIVWTANAYGLVDFLNHRWFEYTGLTAEQSLHGGWRLLIHSEDLPKYEEAWRRAVQSAEPFEVEFRLKRVLGLGGRRSANSAFKAKTSTTKVEPRRDYLWHLCRAVPLKTSQGLVVRWFGTWTEIDEHKARS